MAAATMTKTAMAENIAREARVFVRGARAKGFVNRIDSNALWCAAQKRGYDADSWTINKAARLTVDELERMNELDLIDWDDLRFRNRKPKWMR
jgi:hypothetical protein